MAQLVTVLGLFGFAIGVGWMIVELIKKRRWKPPLAIVMVSVIAFLVGVLITPDVPDDVSTLRMGSLLPTPTFKQEFTLANRVTYDVLLRNIDGHIGESVRFQGRVVEVHNEDRGSKWLQVAVPQGTSGILEGYLRLDYDGEPLATGDEIDLVGDVEGLWDYTLPSGDKMVMPHISGGRAMLVSSESK